MRFDKFKQAFLSYSYTERRAIRGLLIIVAALIVFNALMPWLVRLKKWNQAPYQALMDSLQYASTMADSLRYAKKKYKPYQSSQASSYRKQQIKRFNPDTLDAQAWQLLGLSEKQSLAVISYRNRKGGFRSMSDLQQVRVLSDYFLQRIAPYVDFALDTVRSNTVLQTIVEMRLDINRAGIEDWEKLPGIGTKLAQRIIRFKEKLGGFHRISQIGEVWGMSFETYQRIAPSLMIGDIELAQIHLNYASTSELSAHPYIDFSLASSIVSQRNAYGFFKQVHDLRHLGLVDSEQYDKIAPYLTIK